METSAMGGIPGKDLSGKIDPRPQPTDEILQAIKQIMIAMNGAFKKLNLYSPAHGIYQSALNLLKKLLDAFLQEHGHLKLELQKNAVFYDGVLVQEGRAEPLELANFLYRDGILWLRFESGIELWELETFFKIINEHIVLDENPEDDIVTALWEFNLPSIQYEAADVELAADDLQDFPRLPAPELDNGLPENHRPSPEESQAQSALQDETTPSIKLRNGIWELTPAEREKLRKMVNDEENLDGTDYVIDVLLYILDQKAATSQDISEFMEILMQEFREGLLHARFAYLRSVVTRLKEHIVARRAENHWTAPLLEKFFASISSKAFLANFAKLLPRLETAKESELKDVEGFFLSLDSSAITTLCAILMQSESPKTERLLMEIIGSMANRDFEPLKKMIDTLPPESAVRLVVVLGYLSDPGSRQTLSELLRHPSAMMRKAALRALINRENEPLKEIFPLIDDPDPTVRALVLERMGRQRSQQAENILLSYLEENRFRLSEPEDLEAVCRALGRCGSDRSVAYLEKQLFSWPGIGIRKLGNRRRRQAAMLALEGLKTEKAALLIRKSNRGLLKK